jgi:hypothetical protein
LSKTQVCGAEFRSAQRFARRGGFQQKTGQFFDGGMAKFHVKQEALLGCWCAAITYTQPIPL